MSEYGVALINGVPAVSQIPGGTVTPNTNGNYRTLTAVDIDAAIVGSIGNGGILAGASAIDIGVFYARQYLSATYGPASGDLIDISGAAPVLTTGAGHAVEYNVNGVPMVGVVVDPESVGQDADLLWLNRNFGKR